MDEDTECVVEEGEIFDDSESYTPLERPSNYAATVTATPPIPAPESESDGELQTTTGSDSDSDAHRYRAKKPKVKLKKAPKRKENSKRKKYDIWSTHVHEDILSETLTSCDVSKRDRSRNVESYDYSLGANYYFNEEKERRVTNKRSIKDRNNVHLRLSERKTEGKDESKGAARYLLELIDSSSCTAEEFAKDMANKLCEEKEDLVVKIVSIVGVDKAIAIFNVVKQIESDGGMMIMNQSRRRTPGGIFLFLVKHDSELTREQHHLIFEDERNKYKDVLKEKKKKRIKKMKENLAGSKTNLKELLTKADLIQKLGKDKKWGFKGSDHEEVVNPPPTPETDGHADSGDGMDDVANDISTDATHDVSTDAASCSDPRKLELYNDDFLDVTAGNDMDLF